MTIYYIDLSYPQYHSNTAATQLLLITIVPSLSSSANVTMDAHITENAIRQRIINATLVLTLQISDVMRTIPRPKHRNMIVVSTWPGIGYDNEGIIDNATKIDGYSLIVRMDILTREDYLHLLTWYARNATEKMILLIPPGINYTVAFDTANVGYYTIEPLCIEEWKRRMRPFEGTDIIAYPALMYWHTDYKRTVEHYVDAVKSDTEEISESIIATYATNGGTGTLLEILHDIVTKEMSNCIETMSI